MKRMLSILLTVCMLLSMIPAVLADDTGAETPAFDWSYDEAAGVLVIEGAGPMPAWSNSNAVPWRSYRSKIVAVEIADGITNISNYAFNGCSALKSVIIPNSVTSIGKSAFYGCTSLQTAAIGNGVVELGAQAFASCEKLFAVTIGSGVTEVARETFKNCNAITEVYYMGTEEEWENVTVESSNGALYDFPVEDIFYMDPPAAGTSKDVNWSYDPLTFTLTISGEGAMADYKDTEQDWYDYRKAMQTIIIEDGVTAIGATAFRYCQMVERVSIPASVTEIHENAFAYCKGLKYVFYGSSDGDWNAVQIDGGNDYLVNATFNYAADCEHNNTTETMTPNGDETHSLKVICACGEVLEEGDDIPCIDVSGDKKCEACGGTVAETTECAHGELYVRSTSKANGDKTHTIYDRCTRCMEEFEPYTADCYDSDADELCDLCGGAVCGHGKDKIDNKYEAHDNGTHTQTTTCECGEVVYSGIEDCYDNEEDDDELCDMCGSAVLEKPVCDGTTHPNAEVRYSAADKDMNPEDVYFHFVVLYCPDPTCEKEVGEAWTELCSDGSDDNSICDYCEVGTPCSHEGYETWTDIVSNGNNTHTIYERCNRCDSRVSHEDADCTDENKDSICDVCEGDVEGVFWSLEGGVLTIYGKGAMEDYASFTGMPWSNDRDSVKEIVIAEGVTHIGARSFYRCIYATKVSIASTVESIGDSAFYRCDVLNTVDYNGTEADWEALTAAIGTNNGKLTGAAIEVNCSHEQTTKTMTSDAEAKKHTITETCNKCSEVVSVETVDCAGEPVYTKTETGKHNVTVNCTVCKQLVSENEVDCDRAAKNTANGDRTHTETVTCLDCKQVISTAVIDCVDGEDADELCDTCKQDLHCDHPGYLPAYNSNGDHKTHNYAFYCNVCGEEYEVILEQQDCASATAGKYTCDKCGQDFSCQHEGEAIVSYDYIVNDDRTHTVITIKTCVNPDCELKELSREKAETTTPCVDENNDDYCDICKGNVLCGHTVHEVKYTCHKNWTHTMQIFCTANACGDKLAEKTEPCTDRNADDICDICGGKCEHVFAVTYEKLTGEKHTKVETCQNNTCTKVVRTEEACADVTKACTDETCTEETCTATVHDGKCDKCEDIVACTHVGKTEHVAKNDGSETHDIVSTCTTCGAAEAGCEKCDDFISTVTEACVDADHNQKCDKCGGAVKCLHGGEYTYVSNNDETHKVICKYCGEVTEESARCMNETGNDLKCDLCKHNYAVATTGTNDFMSIAEAIRSLNEVGTVTLLRDVTEDITISKSLTLDLGGKTWTTSTRVTAGEVTIRNGKIVGNGDAIIMGVKNNVKEDVTVDLEETVAIHSETDCAVVIYGGTLNTAATLSAAGTYAVVCGSGNDYGDMNITGGSLTHESDVAIYWPHAGKLTITGGTITGTTALYVKGGTASISGDAKLIGNGEVVAFDHDNNGCQATGDALVVENCDYPAAPPMVTVSGGTFTSANAKAVALYNAEVTLGEVAPFITGGTFSSDVSELCAEGYTCTKSGDLYTVAKAEAPEIKPVNVVGANMTLGNELKINIMIKAADMGDDTYTIRIRQENQTPVELTPVYYNAAYYAVSWGVAAKEMADDLYVEVIDAEGNVVSEPYTTSVRDYAGKALKSENATTYSRTMVVDMLNYGASAQQKLNYNVEDLANNQLTEEQKAMASDPVACENKQVKGKNCYGSNLTLDESILLNVFFSGLKDVDQTGMYAMIEFTNYRGDEKSVRVPSSEFAKYNEDVYKVIVDDIVLSDAKQLVKVTMYNADGTVHGEAVDSVESYSVRGAANDTYGLCSNIMKFAMSAQAYLLNR